jgi:hypothetical protein
MTTDKEDQAEGDMLVFRGFKRPAHLVSSFEEIGGEVEV